MVTFIYECTTPQLCREHHSPKLALVRPYLSFVGAALRKPNRLPEEFYLGHRSYFVTICVQEHKSLFTTEAIVDALISVLREETQHHQFDLYAYCFMPQSLPFSVAGPVARRESLRAVPFFQRPFHRSSQKTRPARCLGKRFLRPHPPQWRAASLSHSLHILKSHSCRPLKRRLWLLVLRFFSFWLAKFALPEATFQPPWKTPPPGPSEM